MKNLVNINTNQPLTMSSREIAEYTGKRHPDVKRDIDVMMIELEIDVSKLARIYKDSMNRDQTEYLLDRDQTDCLLTGYSAKARMSVIKRWKELEQAKPVTLPDLTSEIHAAANRLTLLKKAQSAKEEFDSVITQLNEPDNTHALIASSANTITQVELENRAVMDYVSNTAGRVNFESLCKSVIRRKDSPFKIYTCRGEAREHIRNTVARLDKIITRRIN